MRELKTLVVDLQKQIDQRFDAQAQKDDAQNQRVDAHFKAAADKDDAQNQKADAPFKALMAAFGEFKAQSERANMRVISALSERVAVLKSRRQ